MNNDPLGWSEAPDLAAVRWIAFRPHPDPRGALTAVEGSIDVPFTIQRVFWVHDVRADRGGHAHLHTDQVLIGCHGALKVDVKSPGGERTFLLDDPTRGLFVPRLLFTRLYDFSSDAVCLVLASTHYDISCSIRSWEEYLARVAEQ